MKYTHDSILQKALPSKLTETLNVSIFDSSFLNFLYLGALHFLRRSMHRALNERAMNIRKALQASAFSFIVLNLVEKAVLRFLLIMLNYIKSALRKKQLVTSNAEHLKGNCENTKTISFQFHCSEFIQQKYYTGSHYYRCVTRGRRGRSPLSFLENWEKVP